MGADSSPTRARRPDGARSPSTLAAAVLALGPITGGFCQPAPRPDLALAGGGRRVAPRAAGRGAFFEVEVRTTAEGGTGRRRPVGRGVESGQVAGRAQGQYHDEGSEPRSSPAPDLPHCFPNHDGTFVEVEPTDMPYSDVAILTLSGFVWFSRTDSMSAGRAVCAVCDHLRMLTYLFVNC